MNHNTQAPFSPLRHRRDIVAMLSLDDGDHGGSPVMRDAHALPLPPCLASPPLNFSSHASPISMSR